MWLIYLFDCSPIDGTIPVFFYYSYWTTCSHVQHDLHLMISTDVTKNVWSTSRWTCFAREQLAVCSLQTRNSAFRVPPTFFPVRWCIETGRSSIIVLCDRMVVWSSGMVTTLSLFAATHFSSHCPWSGEEYLLSWLSCSLMWFDICLCSQIKTISHEKSSILILLLMHI